MKKIIITIIALMSVFYTNGQSESESNAAWMAGEYGVWFQLFGGSRLDGVMASGYDYVSGAEEIVEKLPSAGYVLTSLTNSAHGYYFTLRDNTKMDVASIHSDFVPSAANEQEILDVINVFKNAGKKVLLYIATDGPGASAGTPDNAEYTAAWDAFVSSDYNGDEALAYRDLCQGFMERLAPVVDGYWLDHVGGMAGEPEDFVAMIKSVDPTAAIALNNGSEYFTYDDGNSIWVPGVSDFRVERDFRIKKHKAFTSSADYTGGHPTPLGHGAPPNNWSVEEFTHCDMINEPWDSYEGKKILKHAFVPMQNYWTPPTADLMFTDVEQAYRFVRRLTDAGAAMTWSTSNSFGRMSDDEMEILEEVDRRMQMNIKPDYIPYTRPNGASLIGDDATCTEETTTTTTTTEGALVHITKRNATGYAIDGGSGGANRQSVTLSSADTSDEDQLWIEIDKGNGYYSYEKYGTNYSLDGGDNGVNNQVVYLWTTNETNQNQQWQKVSVGDGGYKLIKRNADGFAINGGSGGVEGRGINLYDSENSSQNLQWYITHIYVVENVRLEAEDYDAMSGVKTETSSESGENVGYINNEDWLRFDAINLLGITNMDARVSSKFTGGDIEVRTGSVTGTLIGSITVNNTGGDQNWTTLTTSITSISDVGEQDVFLVFTGGNGYLFNVNWIEFNTSLQSNKDIEKIIGEISDVTIYPNPVISTTTIENAANSEITIYDMNGIVVLNKSILTNSEIIDLSKLLIGIYYVKINNKSTQTITKFIKQ